MIKVNVIVRDNVWLKYIKDPKLYLKKKVKKIQKKINFFQKIKYLILIYYYQAQKKYEL